MRYGYWKSPEVPRTFQTICSGDWLGSSPHARRCRGCVRCPRTSKNRNAQRDVEAGNSKFVKSVSSECNLGILDFFSLTKFHLWVRNFREGKLFVRKSYCKQKMNLIIVFFYVIKSHKKKQEIQSNTCRSIFFCSNRVLNFDLSSGRNPCSRKAPNPFLETRQFENSTDSVRMLNFFLMGDKFSEKLEDSGECKGILVFINIFTEIWILYEEFGWDDRSLWLGQWGGAAENHQRNVRRRNHTDGYKGKHHKSLSFPSKISQNSSTRRWKILQWVNFHQKWNYLKWRALFLVGSLVLNKKSWC